MEIRRIFSLLSPVKSRIAVLSFFIGKLCLFYNTVDQQEADQSYTIILHIEHYCKENACSVYHFFEFVLHKKTICRLRQQVSPIILLFPWGKPLIRNRLNALTRIL